MMSINGIIPQIQQRQSCVCVNAEEQDCGVCEFASTLSKYELRNNDGVPSWARVRLRSLLCGVYRWWCIVLCGWCVCLVL